MRIYKGAINVFGGWIKRNWGGGARVLALLKLLDHRLLDRTRTLRFRKPRDSFRIGYRGIRMSTEVQYLGRPDFFSINVRSFLGARGFGMELLRFS